MVFNTFTFIVFFGCVYVAYRLLGHKSQNHLLLLASYFFYASWDWHFLFLLLASTLIDYFCAIKIDQTAPASRRKSWLTLSICVNLVVLVFFKYANFFSHEFSVLLNSLGMQTDQFTLNVLLPVGVSFYTFQSIGYIVDVYSNKVKAERNLGDYALFVAFFPQLVAGPIERAQHMLPQYKSPRVITPQKNKEGLWFIYWGFFLKVFVADNMARVVDLVFTKSGHIPGIEVLLGSYAFAFQIFGDFAGYSFIAMGLGRLLGLDLIVNFRFPYFVENPSDFWKHWHISLSAWLRDYLYIPLGGNRGGELKTYRNLMITMLLGGLWHGAAWTFVLWGVFQGLMLSAYRLSKAILTNRSKQSWLYIRVFKVIIMFQITCIGWLIFRAGSLQQLRDFLYSLVFNFSAPSNLASYIAAQIIFYTGLLLIIQGIQRYKNNLMAIPELSGFRPWFFYLAMFYLLTCWGEFGGKQFIYFQF